MIAPHERVIIADATPPKDIQPATINWHYTENHTSKDNRVEVRGKNLIKRHGLILNYSIKTGYEFIKQVSLGNKIFIFKKYSLDEYRSIFIFSILYVL